MAGRSERGPGNRAAGVAQLGGPTRRVGVAGAVGQSLAVGPIVSVAVFGGFLAAQAGGAAGFPVLLAGVGALALAWLVAGYARRVSGAGAVYEYVDAALGRRAGALTAVLYAAALVFVSVGGSFVLLGILGEPFAQAHLGFDPPWWAVGLAGLAIVVTLTHLGVGLAVRVQLGLAVLSAIPIAILVVVVIADGGASGNTLSVFDPTSATRGPDIFRGLLFAVTLFQGFEAAASLGEESTSPRRTIPRALLLTVVLAAAWFVLVVYAGTIGFGPARSASAWGGDPSGLSTLARRYVGAWDATLIDLAVLLDLVAVVMATTNTAARTAFALSRDGYGPRAIGRVSSRHGTPSGGIALVLAASLLVLGVVAAAEHGPAGRLEAIGILAVAGTLIVQAVYLVLVAGALPGLRSARSPAAAVVVVVAATVPVLAIYGTVHPFPPGRSAWGVWGALVAVTLATVWLLVLRRRGPVGQGVGELGPGAHAELGVDAVQVRGDGPV